MQPYVAVLALLGLLAAVVAAVYALSFTLAPPGGSGTGPFLSGMRPQEHALSRYHVRWYVVTMVFLAFDMEMIFMYPWGRVLASSSSISFWVAFGMATSHLIIQGLFPSKYCAPYLSAYSFILPLLTFFSSIMN